MVKIFGIKVKNWSICVIPHGVEDKLFEKIDKDILNSYRNKINVVKNNGHNFLFIGIIAKIRDLMCCSKLGENILINILKINYI